MSKEFVDALASGNNLEAENVFKSAKKCVENVVSLCSNSQHPTMYKDWN